MEMRFVLVIYILTNYNTRHQKQDPKSSVAWLHAYIIASSRSFLFAHVNTNKHAHESHHMYMEYREIIDEGRKNIWHITSTVRFSHSL